MTTDRESPHREGLDGRGPGAGRRPSGGPRPQRAVENFPISGQPIERELIAGLALIKGASAPGFGPARPARSGQGRAIAAAADEVARGDWDAEFPIDVFQTGSGTSSNMNANEVLASLAAERLGCAGAPERRRQRPALVQRPVPVRDPRRRHQRRRHRPDPGLAHLAAALDDKAERVRRPWSSPAART